MPEIIPANIVGVRVISGGGIPPNIGYAKNKIWQSPARLHFVAMINEEPDPKYDKEYKLHCTLKNDGKLIQDGLEFSHGTKGCKNPCTKTEIAGNAFREAYFTANVSKPGKHKVTIGNSPDSGFTTSFEIVEKYDPQIHGK